MSAGLDQTHVRHAFGRAARTYEENAVLQAEIGLRLRERLDEAEFAPQRVLDVGCGPGLGTAQLRERWPQAQVIALDLALPMLHAAAQRAGSPPAFARVGGDAQALPLADASVDLVHSNLCLQWCEDPGLAIAEFRRVLRPGGLLLFSTFGPDTLKELRAAFATVDDKPHVSRFVDMHDIGDALLLTGFRDPVLEREDFVLTYRDARTLMRELRAIGATNADAQRTRALSGKTRFARVIEAFEAFRVDGVLPATYEVIHAAAWAPEPGQPRRERGADIATFPVDRLPVRRRR